MTGRLIVFEGLSAAGKLTQTQLMLAALEKNGKTATAFYFPDYSSPVGQLIAEYLSGALGKKEDRIHEAVVLYALDRYCNAEKIRMALAEYDCVILDRYTPANLAFQGALVSDEKEKRALWKWIDLIEKNLPRPDAIIFLDVPRNVTRALYAARKQKNPLTKIDIHELDTEFESRVYENYLQLARERNWLVIKTVEGDQLLPPKAIHERVWDALKAKAIL